MENEQKSRPDKMDKSYSYDSPIKTIFEKFTKQTDVNLVFGEPIEHADKRVIPVAKVNYYVGGGGGFSGESSNPNQGEGGGGYFSVKPMGVYEITPQKTSFKPLFEPKLIFLLLFIFTFGLVKIFKK